MPAFCKFRCVRREELTDVPTFTFLDNYTHMTRATRPVREEMSMLVLYMLYTELIVKKKDGIDLW